MNVIGHKYLFLTISGALVLISIVLLTVWGLKPAIDFTGGSLLEVEFASDPPSADAVRELLEPLGVGAFQIQPTAQKGFILRFRPVDESTHQQMLARLRAPYAGNLVAVVEKRFDSIGPTIGRELRTRSLIALLTAVVAIILYIAWAFRRVSEPVSSWKYGVVAVIALLHDVLIPTGLFALLGRFASVEVDTLFITALLTVMGFSVHDTIVVFDRIRENLGKGKSRDPFDRTVNQSIQETVTRSINTSFTVLLVLAAIFFFGGGSTRYFALTLMVGIGVGTYSSIFVASPLLVLWNQRRNKQQ